MVKKNIYIPCLFLQNQVRLHKEFDAQPQPTGHHIVHLLADAVPQIQPQVLAFGAGELQPEVVHLNDAQLPANLERNKCRIRNMRENKDEDVRGVRGAWTRSWRAAIQPGFLPYQVDAFTCGLMFLPGRTENLAWILEDVLLSPCLMI